MGIYTTREGIAVATCSGDKCHHVSWHPAFVQPDGSYLYPAEELHRLVTAESPDTTVLFDVGISIAPLSVTLPKLKPQQVFQALKIELASRSIDEVLAPAIGFCPGQLPGVETKRAGLSGFALAMASEALQALKGKHRPLGITPSLVTLPIFPLVFALAREREVGPSLVFLTEGKLVMVATVRDTVIEELEVFFGDEAALAERLQRHLSEFPQAMVYGFEAVASRGTRSSSPDWGSLFQPLEEGQNPELLVRKRRSISRETLAILLARLPLMLGTLEYGGIRAEDTARKGTEHHVVAIYVSALIVFILLGIGGVLGVKSWVDRSIYKSQKRAMRRLVKSVLPNAPPVATLSLVKSKIERVERQRRHLIPFLKPSTLKIPSQVLSVLDRVGKLEVSELSSTGDSLKLVFESPSAVDPQSMEEKLRKNVKGDVRVSLLKGRPAHIFPTGMVYSLVIERPEMKGEKTHAQ
jgi:hypothetical protein